MVDSEDSKSVYEAALENFLSPVLEYLRDPSVSEILINGPNDVFVETKGKLIKSPARFPDEDSLVAAVNNIAQSVGRRISKLEPRLDARLPDGSRIHAVLPPVARNGTTLSIRKFTQNSMTFRDYIKLGSIDIDAAKFLDICMFLGKNSLISGGTGSGKTTLLSLLCSRIPKGQRLIVIEDASELDIPYEHVVRFETQMPNAQGDGEVTMRDLLKSSLRLRPDRIIVGEVRGAEALELINAMNTGHRGSMGTVHANSPSDAVVRLEGLAMGGDSKISLKAIQQQIGSALEVIVQISRFPDGSRRVQMISEVLGVEKDGTYNIQPVYFMSPLKKGADGRLVGALQPTGYIPTFMDEIEANRIPFSREKFLNKSAA